MVKGKLVKMGTEALKNTNKLKLTPEPVRGKTSKLNTINLVCDFVMVFQNFAQKTVILQLMLLTDFSMHVYCVLYIVILCIIIFLVMTL